MPDRMSEYMSGRLLECMPDKMPGRFQARMLEYMSDRMAGGAGGTERPSIKKM